MTYLASALLVIGGALGATARYLLHEYVVYRRGGRPQGFPLATLIANVVGALLLGLISGLAELGAATAPPATALAGVGFCGAFTTFSTLSVELAIMLRGRRWGLFFGYLSATLVLGLSAALLGLTLARLG